MTAPALCPAPLPDVIRRRIDAHRQRETERDAQQMADWQQEPKRLAAARWNALMTARANVLDDLHDCAAPAIPPLDWCEHTDRWSDILRVLHLAPIRLKFQRFGETWRLTVITVVFSEGLDDDGNPRVFRERQVATLDAALHEAELFSDDYEIAERTPF